MPLCRECTIQGMETYGNDVSLLICCFGKRCSVILSSLQQQWLEYIQHIAGNVSCMYYRKYKQEVKMPSVWHQFLGKSPWVGRSFTQTNHVSADDWSTGVLHGLRCVPCMLHWMQCSAFPSLRVCILREASGVARHPRASLLPY